ncbi:MAG: hypothetical protein EOM55_00920 [Clostridia bacterium]|nr:hypothetical protein [Clostridia bacterium]
MGKKKIPKSFTISLLVFLGSLIAIIAVSFCVMFFSPGTEILGYQYISYTNPMTRTYTESSSVSLSNINAIKIITNSSAISVNAGQTNSQIYVNYSRNIYGIVRSENSEIIFSDYVITNGSFEEDEINGTYRTLIIDITEPTGFVSSSDSIVQVYLPSNILFEVVYLSSENGNIIYNSTSQEKNISASNLYLMSSGGDVTINNTQTCDNYYLKTKEGKVTFSSASISANKVKFESEGGSLNLTNSTNDATITVTDGLYIKSTGNTFVCVNVLNGNLNIESQSGTFSFGQIGTSSSEKVVSVSSAQSTLNFGTVYGTLNAFSNDGVGNSTMTVAKLVNTSENIDSISSGSGNVVIEEINSPLISISSTTGNIYLQKVSTTTSVYSYSTSGIISVSYIESSTRKPETKVKVFSKTGSISLSNISGFFEVQVLENSSFSRLDIVLCAVCYEAGNEHTNIILAKNRNINLTFKGYENDLICRILSFREVLFVDSSTSQVLDGDFDYILDDYSGYNYQYRVGYVQPTNGVGAVYDGKGKIFLTNTENVVISFQID